MCIYKAVPDTQIYSEIVSFPPQRTNKLKTASCRLPGQLSVLSKAADYGNLLLMVSQNTDQILFS